MIAKYKFQVSITHPSLFYYVKVGGVTCGWEHCYVNGRVVDQYADEVAHASLCVY